MKTSLNGFQSQISRSGRKLKRELDEFLENLEGYEYDKTEKIREAFNEVAQYINLACCFVDEDTRKSISTDDDFESVGYFKQEE